MRILAIIIIGAAAGYVVTRLLRLETDALTTIVIGIIGAFIGWEGLRLLLAATGLFAGFMAAAIGAMLFIWLILEFRHRR